MDQRQTYTKNEMMTRPIPNYWDMIALILVLALIFFVCLGAKAMVAQYQPGTNIPISLDPSYLPYYALRSVLRMFIAMACSLLFTFTFATWAAKSRGAGRIIVPMIDILQSVPILGLLPIAMIGFVALFPRSLLGPECAAIFAIFTAQVWNMTLSFYQSLLTVPDDLKEASSMFQLSPWQQFWRIEVPFAMPGLLWNAMLSMSASWVFLVASEAITVANHQITLPGLGSYIALAIQNKNTLAIFYVIIAMFLVIAIYDQLIFRPLVAWAEKFKAEVTTGGTSSESWVLNLFQRTRFFRFLGQLFSNCGDKIINLPWLRTKSSKSTVAKPFLKKIFEISGNIIIVILIVVGIWFLLHFIYHVVPYHESLHVIYLGLITGLRVLSMIIISSIIWVPIGVWIGLNPRASQIVQPLIQFLAAFPANLLFGIAAYFILKYNLNVNIWTSPLMILGTQWYILFNVIAGVIALPKNLHHAVGSLNVTGWLWWKRFVLPGIFPFYITGAITAAGGAWNISIISEAVSWGQHQLWATGLGAYITKTYNAGDFPRLALGVAVMCLFVVTINRVIWKPLYRLAEKRYQIR